MTGRPITERSVDAAYRRLQSDRHQRFEAEVNSAPIVDMIGDGRMEYDGPRCGADCGEPVDVDDEMCEECADQPHEYRHDGSRFDFCVCGRIEAIGWYSPVHIGFNGGEPA